jgi:hypothetical protein
VVRIFLRNELPNPAEYLSEQPEMTPLGTPGPRVQNEGDTVGSQGRPKQEKEIRREKITLTKKFPPRLRRERSMKTKISLRITLTLVLGLLVTATIASGQDAPRAVQAPQTPPQARYFAPQYVDAQDVAVAPQLEQSWQITVMPNEDAPFVTLATFTALACCA